MGKSISSILESGDFPKLDFDEFYNKDMTELEKVYGPTLIKLGVFDDASAERFRDVMVRKIDRMQTEVQERVVDEIMTGKRVFNSPEDLKDAPLYRKENEDGTVSIVNIPTDIQWYLSLLAYVNEKYKPE